MRSIWRYSSTLILDETENAVVTFPFLIVRVDPSNPFGKGSHREKRDSLLYLHSDEKSLSESNQMREPYHLLIVIIPIHHATLSLAR